MLDDNDKKYIKETIGSELWQLVAVLTVIMLIIKHC
jgi:hypothetical protein